MKRYGQLLGMHFPEDEEYLYIANEGLLADLPREWKLRKLKNGQMVFWNQYSNSIQKENPLIAVFRKKFMEEKGIVDVEYEKDVTSLKYLEEKHISETDEDEEEKAISEIKEESTKKSKSSYENYETDKSDVESRGTSGKDGISSRKDSETIEEIFGVKPVSKMKPKPEEDRKVEEEFDPNYEPSQKEIIFFAKEIGIILPKEEDFLWISKEGLKAPMPKNWSAYQAKNGNFYFKNLETGEKQIEHPSITFSKALLQKAREEKAQKHLTLQLNNTSTSESLHETAINTEKRFDESSRSLMNETQHSEKHNVKFREPVVETERTLSPAASLSVGSSMPELVLKPFKVEDKDFEEYPVKDTKAVPQADNKSSLEEIIEINQDVFENQSENVVRSGNTKPKQDSSPKISQNLVEEIKLPEKEELIEQNLVKPTSEDELQEDSIHSSKRSADEEEQNYSADNNSYPLEPETTRLDYLSPILSNDSEDFTLQQPGLIVDLEEYEKIGYSKLEKVLEFENYKYKLVDLIAAYEPDILSLSKSMETLNGYVKKVLMKDYIAISNSVYHSTMDSLENLIKNTIEKINLEPAYGKYQINNGLKLPQILEMVASGFEKIIPDLNIYASSDRPKKNVLAFTDIFNNLLRIMNIFDVLNREDFLLNCLNLNYHAIVSNLLDGESICKIEYVLQLDFAKVSKLMLASTLSKLPTSQEIHNLLIRMEKATHLNKAETYVAGAGSQLIILLNRERDSVREFLRSLFESVLPQGIQFNESFLNLLKNLLASYHLLAQEVVKLETQNNYFKGIKEGTITEEMILDLQFTPEDIQIITDIESMCLKIKSITSEIITFIEEVKLFEAIQGKTFFDAINNSFIDMKKLLVKPEESIFELISDLFNNVNSLLAKEKSLIKEEPITLRRLESPRSTPMSIAYKDPNSIHQSFSKSGGFQPKRVDISIDQIMNGSPKTVGTPKGTPKSNQNFLVGELDFKSVSPPTNRSSERLFGSNSSRSGDLDSTPRRLKKN